MVIASLDLVRGTKDCDLVIVCDRMKVIEADKKTNWKSGKVNNEYQLKYEEYIETLRKRYLSSNSLIDNTTSVTNHAVENGNDATSPSPTNALDKENEGRLKICVLKVELVILTKVVSNQSQSKHIKYLFAFYRTYRRSQAPKTIEK